MINFHSKRVTADRIRVVSIFWTNSTSLKLYQGRKHSASRIDDDNFRGVSFLLMLLHEQSIFQLYWQPLSSPILIFNFPNRRGTFNNRQRPYIRQKHSPARIKDGFNRHGMGELFIHNFLDVGEE
jgi:hypothetical protein